MLGLACTFSIVELGARIECFGPVSDIAVGMLAADKLASDTMVADKLVVECLQVVSSRKYEPNDLAFFVFAPQFELASLKIVQCSRQRRTPSTPKSGESPKERVLRILEPSWTKKKTRTK